MWVAADGFAVVCAAGLSRPGHQFVAVVRVRPVWWSMTITKVTVVGRKSGHRMFDSVSG
jgi:acyl-homoserine lactone acylase PvdQ